MRITACARSKHAAIEGLLSAACYAFVPDAAGFETDIWPGSLPALNASITVNWAEVGLIEGLPDTVGGWVLINYVRSVACSPPRACYANAQRVYVLAFCRIGAIKDLQRISLDLNGNAVAETGERVAYIPSAGSVDRAVMRTLCGAYGFYHRPWGAEREED
jgi:hypothetical protein